MMLALFTVAATAASGARCSAPATPADVDKWLAAAEQAAVTLDADGFSEALTKATDTLDCLDEIAPTSVVARYDRDEGLRLATVGRDGVRARQAWLAAKTLDPSAPSANLFPAGSGVAKDYDAITGGPGSSTPLPVPAAGTTYVDGAPSTTRPTDRCALLQVVDSAHHAQLTVWLYGDDPTPAYPSMPTASSPPPVKKRGHGISIGLMAGTVVLGAAAAGVYGVAAYDAKVFRDPNDGLPPAGLKALAARTDALVYGSGGLGLLAVGTGIGAAVSW